MLEHVLMFLLITFNKETAHDTMRRDMKTNISISPKEFKKMREHILGKEKS